MMKQTLKLLLLFLLLTLVLTFKAQVASAQIACDQVTKITTCGQTTYDTCSQSCSGITATYNCVASQNTNCQGTISCSSENSRCGGVTYPTPASSSSCSTPSLAVRNTQDTFTYSPDSGVIMNDSPTQSNLLYATANTSGCSGSPLYNFIIWYWDGSSWVRLEDKAWLTANNTYLSMSAGERAYMVGVRVLDSGTNVISSTTYSYFYFGMTKTASSSNITSTSANLSWSLRMNHYIAVSCDANTPCGNRVKSYLLIGKDSSILTNRTASGDIGPIDMNGTDYDSSTQRITWTVDNYSVFSLDPSSTYYWRIRAAHPNGTNSFFAGGSFTTTASPPKQAHFGIVTRFQISGQILKDSGFNVCASGYTGYPGATLTVNPALLNVSDSFNRADNTNSLGNADTGQPWMVVRGAWGISNNTAYPSNGCPAPGYAVVDSGSTDGTIQVTATVNPQDTRIPFRVQDENNLYWVERRGGSPGQYSLDKMVGGVRSTLAASNGISPQDGDIIKIILNGPGISVYINGVLAMTVSDSSITSTRHGIGTWCTGAIRFDNFSIIPIFTSSSSGNYLFSGLLGGSYSLSVSNYTASIIAQRINGTWLSTSSSFVSLNLPPSQTVDFCINTLQPWIKTTSGDVHTNTNINTPGGP